MIKIKMMPDYHCYPLWGAMDENIGNIDPKSLPISKELIKDLTCWAKQYDSTLNLEDPLNSGFPDENSALLFKKNGEELFLRLKKELGGNYLVFLKI